MAKIFEVEILKVEPEYSLEELCHHNSFSTEFIIQCVDYGIAEVEGEEAVEWKFSPVLLQRLQRAHRLQRDLDINFTGLAVVLDLLDEMEELKSELGVLRKKIKSWEC